MPRGPRVDVPGGLYHVIGRGVERRPIFRTDGDREDFLARLATVVDEEALRLFAFVLMGNHFHLVVRRKASSLGHAMKRVLTGYGVSFNLRHRRAGHLFENRYKAVLCQEDAYLVQLVRYVHLNPVRAKMVGDPHAYPWSSHRYYLRPRGAPSWIDVGTVLEMLGGRASYRRFIADGMTEGQRSDLCGKGGRGELGAEVEGERRVWLGGQILGSERFVRGTLKTTRKEELKREMQKDVAVANLPSLVAEVARRFGMEVAALRGGGRDAATSSARRELVRRAVLGAGVKPADVARYLNLRPASVTGHLRALRGTGASSSHDKLIN
jgi:putative transposase